MGMPTDAVLLVESVRDGVRSPDFLIFVKGGCFNSVWELTGELEAFCGKNSKGFEMSYYAGVTSDELCDRFGEYLSNVNVLFARNRDELKILKIKLGVVEEAQEPQHFTASTESATDKLSSLFEDICYHAKALFFALTLVCLVFIAIILAPPVILLVVIIKYVLDLVEWLRAKYCKYKRR